jgi:hypothetical protein
MLLTSVSSAAPTAHPAESDSLGGLRDGLASTFGDVGVPGAAAAAGARTVLFFDGVVLEDEA